MDTLERQQSGSSLSPTSTNPIMFQHNNDSSGSLQQSTDASILSSTTNGDRHFCVVCGDESDGLHFGQYTCRACAAFFRRTVSLKLQYTCKHDGNCAIEKSARNMCRACRFEKCLLQGMLTTAVQHARDGLGKRKEVQKLSTAPATVGCHAGRHKFSIQRIGAGISIQTTAYSSTNQNVNSLTPPALHTYSTAAASTSTSSPVLTSSPANVLVDQSKHQAAATILHLNGNHGLTGGMSHTFGFPPILTS
uniref:Nuclear receptor domain-containing protein n=1 Tax=Ditylenchus dipsaci TaxID=166011 RepID=A0A915ELQ6_9BILA